MAEFSSDTILTDICAGRTELEQLGRHFNKEAAQRSDTTDMESVAKLNATVDAIFELEDISLSDSEKKLVKQLDQLNWTDEQVVLFLQAMGRV
ncbi:hypothetical protein [Microbulbifer epialgicus]|uniref:YfcL protein n=1 Tax=Microbulbifer epialgicus TaxID=393907 RepID=A0ABV4NTW0_9GAMM